MTYGDRRMEGWLYMIRSDRFGLQHSRKRYFVLEHNQLKSFKSAPDRYSQSQDLVRSAVIDTCIRVTDNGKEIIQGKVFYIFTIYNTSNQDDQLKLGATSRDEAARWVQTFQELALKAGSNFRDKALDCWPSLCRFTGSSKICQSNVCDWSLNSSPFADPSVDIIAPNQWTIFGCQNGLRLFQEPKDTQKDDHPALMAVGVVEGTPERIFQTLMSLGPSRSEWDFCFYKGSVVEYLDSHSDIIHKQFHGAFMPRGMKPRDLVLRRLWRREGDGTYVILYHSVFHKQFPTQKGYVRAFMKSGGYVIAPTNQEKLSAVKHMLAIDWKFGTSHKKLSLARSITIKMLERIAALREMFRAKSGNISSCGSSSGELSGERQQCQIGVNSKVDSWAIENNGISLGTTGADLGRTLSSLCDLNDADDEFFDVPEPTYYNRLEDDWASSFDPEYQDLHHSKFSTAANFTKELHGLPIQRKGYVDLQEMESLNGVSDCFGCTLRKDLTGTMPSSYSTADPSTFLIRGKRFFKDGQKVKRGGTLMQLVGADWIRTEKREDNLAGRPNSIVQKYAAKGRPEFFFVINFQIPGTRRHNLAIYYMMSTPLEDAPLMERFVNGDDAFRNSRFKLIPCVTKGPWIVKQTVKNIAYLIGQYITINYYRGTNYLELSVDVGSSNLATASANLVFRYFGNLVIDLGFLIQANTPEELPEYLIGTCRLNHIDPSDSVPLPT